jgi:prepilin-type N-terminal cleavage/methylation domain-containing protein
MFFKNEGKGKLENEEARKSFFSRFTFHVSPAGKGKGKGEKEKFSIFHFPFSISPSSRIAFTNCRHPELVSGFFRCSQLDRSRNKFGMTWEFGKFCPAFSLAEVLITLMIIGVVAAMTIPTLIKNYQKITYVTGLKKAYSVTNQALQQMAADYGCINDLACTGVFGLPNNGSLGNIFVKYFNVAKNCGTADNQGCWSATTNQNYDGSSTNTYSYDAFGYGFITADGMSFLLTETYYEDNCSHSFDKLTQVCMEMVIDVNGPNKGPNYYGRDVFYFFVTNSKGTSFLYPWGGPDTYQWDGGPYSGGCKTNDASRKDGRYCAGRVMEEGWEMKY